MKTITLLITLTLLLVSRLTLGAEPYLGASMGSSSINLDGYDQGFFYKVYAGARKQYYGFEASYARLAKFDISGNNTGAISSSGIEASGISFLPLSSNLELFVKIGIFSWTATGKYNGGLVPKNKGTDFSYSFGGQYNATEKVTLRAEFQRFKNIIGGDISSISSGASYRF